MYKVVKKQIEMQNLKDEIKFTQEKGFYHDILDKQLQLAEPRVGPDSVLTFVVVDNSYDIK